MIPQELNDLREKLEQLAARERVLQETLRPVHEAWCEVRKEYVEKFFGCAAGAIVLDRHDQPHRVVGIDRYWGCDKPWVTANPMKKDGTWGIAKRNLYSSWTPKP
jgi:hypothetical protein